MRITTHYGFSLMELMIAIAIVSILAVIAVPTYLNHTRKAYYSEIVMAATPYKTAVIECYHLTGDLNLCNGGSHSIPANIEHAVNGIASLKVVQGEIIAVPVAKNGLTGDDNYILQPQLNHNVITWQVSGGAVERGYVRGN